MARVRNAEYFGDVEGLKSELGINMVINPEYATAVEISRLLRFPSAANIDTFRRGKVELVGFRTQQGDFLNGLSLSALGAPHSKSSDSVLCGGAGRQDLHPGR